MKLVTAEEIRKIDAATIEKFGIPGIVLMENAGRAVAQAVRELLVDARDAHVLIICGKGNNGGDGFVTARHLSNQGYTVHTILLGNLSDLSGDAATNARIARNMGLRLTENADAQAVRALVPRADLIVDAILGTGISGEVRDLPRAAIEAINASGARVVAVDIPSGVNADTGAICGEAVRADVTVTFAAAKLGLVQFPAAELCGDLRVADIAIPRSLTESPSLKANLATEAMARALLPQRHSAMHKGDAGRAGIVAGSVGMTGAAALCAEACVRSGAGLVYLACPLSLNDILEHKCSEALTVPLPETPERSLSAEACAGVLELAGRVDALALGPGLSQNPETAELVREVVPQVPIPLVLDADGLNCLGGALALLRGRGSGTVITPHPGELARLMGTTIEAIEGDRVAAARRAAREAGAVTVLKGAATVVAEPGGEVWVNPTGNPGMASGGMGDVLTGMIAAFLAGGADAVAAAVSGAYFHGLAGDIAAGDGERGLIATDVAWALQEALGD